MENFVLWVAITLVLGIVFYFIVAGKKSAQILPSQRQIREITTKPNELVNNALNELAKDRASEKSQKTKYTSADIAWDSIPDDFVIFDLETTGLKQDEVVDIIEIAAVRFNKKKYLETKAVDTFSSLVKPWRGGLNLGAMAVNKITQEMIDQDARDMPEVLKEFVEFVGDRPLVAYNVAFDRWFLKRELSDQRISQKFSYSCALDLARVAFPNLENHKLSTVASQFGQVTSGAHRALQDCVMTLQVYLWSLTKIQWEVDDAEAWKKVQPIEGLAGKSIVFVGKFRLLTKRDAESFARRTGMIVKATVSKNVDIVVVGKDAGDKEQRAIQLNKQILSELEFGNMILPLLEQLQKANEDYSV